LKIGTERSALKQGKHNKFYGSFKSWKNLTYLISICIEATDVSEGLEYLPESLTKESRGFKNGRIQCFPHETNAKCSQIQKLKLTKPTIHQQTQTNFPVQEKRTQNEVKDNPIPLTEEERKWETIKIGIEKETDLIRLANGDYWDTQIQNLPDNLLPANKKSIVLKNRLQQQEQQLKREKNKFLGEQLEAKIEKID